MYILEFSNKYEGIHWQKFYKKLKNAKKQIIEDIKKENENKDLKLVPFDPSQPETKVFYKSDHYAMVIYKAITED
tara:strand:- start:1797 stop:2021 length:225 start_codon:yes stop_codon:yes gene_type:complete